MSDNRNKLIMSYPASFWTAKWRDALPVGNGEIGASMYGAVHNECILLNHEDLWADSKKEPLPDISSFLPDVREMLLKGNVHEAQDYLTNKLINANYETIVASPLPLGDLIINHPITTGFANYSRVLDMETGEAATFWNDNGTNFSRKLFVSRADNIVVLRLDSGKTGGLNGIALKLDIHDKSNSFKPFGLGVEQLPERVDSYAESDYIFYAADYPGLDDFGAVARLICQDGTAESSKDGILLHDVTSCTVLISLFANSNRDKEWKRNRDLLSTFKYSYEKLLERHSSLHRKLFLSSEFSVKGSKKEHNKTNEDLLLDAYRTKMPDALLEKMWSFGRYLLISACRESGHPCPLLGLWHGDYRAYWSFHMLNENLQMIYWMALSGNMPELLLSVFDYYESMMNDFRLNAKNLFGCRGIFIPAVTTPNVGTVQCILPHILNWTAGAAWLCQHYYEYYLYTNDMSFLKNRALPVMRDAALFYEDFLIKDKNGLLMSIPSVSPENTPGNYYDGNSITGLAVTINATMDIAAVRELLTNLLEGCKLTDMYTESTSVWQEMLCSLPPYEANDDGAVKEWLHPMFDDNYHHRHLSHIYALFPGKEIISEDDPKQFDMFVNAVEKRLIIGLSQQTSWSLAHMAAIFARIGDGSRGLECLNNITRAMVMNNLFTAHNDWRNMGIGLYMASAPFQIDANMGFTAAINEMLIFSRGELIKILPALPDAWQSGQITGLAAHGKITVDIFWNPDTISVKLKTEKEAKIRLIFSAKFTELLQDGKEIAKNSNEVNVTFSGSSKITAVRYKQ